MANHESKTQDILIRTAGELFADHGFDGVSTRMIADKAGVNLGGIHYHFGNKERLYIAAFKYVCKEDGNLTLTKVILQNPELQETPEGIAEAIYLTCESFISDLFDPELPKWSIRMILKELSNPSSAMPTLVEEVFKENFDSDIEIFHKAKPNATENEAIIWRSFMKGIALFYTMTIIPHKIMLGKDSLGQEFTDSLIKMTAKSVIALADLPLPEKLK